MKVTNKIVFWKYFYGFMQENVIWRHIFRRSKRYRFKCIYFNLSFTHSLYKFCYNVFVYTNGVFNWYKWSNFNWHGVMLHHDNVNCHSFKILWYNIIPVIAIKYFIKLAISCCYKLYGATLWHFFLQWCFTWFSFIISFLTHSMPQFFMNFLCVLKLYDK